MNIAILAPPWTPSLRCPGTPDGTRRIASYDTGHAYVWDVRLESLVGHACRTAGRRLTGAEWAEFLPDRPYDPAC
jgi:hypothetical protein